MSVSSVLGEAFDLYRRFFWRFVATAAVVFVVLDLASAFADQASGSSTGSQLLWTLIALVLSVVGAFWLQGALIEAVRDVRDGRIDTTIGELYERTRPRLAALIAAGIVAAIGIAFGLVLLIVPGLFLLPDFLAVWIGGIVAHSITTPFIAAVGAVLYFRLARLSVAVAPAAQVPEA